MPKGVYSREGKRKPLEERFLSKVEKSEGCWSWTGALSANQRYGSIQRGGGGPNRKQLLRAHRASWEIYNGPIPDGLCVLHSCDNTHCVNPEHLFLGTQADNIADMMAKGRHRRVAKLTDIQARQIKYSNARPKDLAEEYGVSAQLICNIRSGRAWRHIS